MSSAALDGVFCTCRRAIAQLPETAPDKRQQLVYKGCGAPMFRRCAAAWRDAEKIAPDKRWDHIARACAKAYCRHLGRTKPALCTGAKLSGGAWTEFLQAAGKTESVDPAAGDFAHFLAVFLGGFFEVKVRAVQAPKAGARKAPGDRKKPLNLTIILRQDRLEIKTARDSSLHATIPARVTARAPAWRTAPMPSGARWATVTITKDDVSFAGHGAKPTSFLPLSSFVVASKHKEAGSATSFLIAPLFKRAEAYVHREKDFAKVKNMKFGGIVRIRAAAATPYKTVVEVIHSLGTAGMSDLRLEVVGASGKSPGGFLPPDLRALYDHCEARYREAGYSNFKRYVVEQLDISPTTAFGALAVYEHFSPAIAARYGRDKLTAGLAWMRASSWRRPLPWTS